MKKFPPVAKDKESGLPKKYVAGLSASTAKARAAHWKKAAKLSDSDPRAYKPAPGDATAKTKPSKYTKRFHKMFGEQIGIVIEGAPEKIEGTNCANCIHWVKESEKPVDKSELNEYGGLKAPNEAYVEMSKHVDLVTLPGKAVVKIKAYCNHEDIHDFVTERMCCAYWDGEGVKREFKGVSPKMDESVELDETIVKVDGKFRLVSKKTGRNLGTYDTKAGAMKRERQVQYFKHMGEEEMKESVKTANPGRGYHGEHPADKADAKYAEMFHKVRKSIVAGNASDKKIKNYLDSTHGRHLAGRENDTEYLHKDFKRFEKTYNPQHFDEATAYKPKVGDRISTIKGGQNTGKVEKVEGGHVYFRSDYKRSTLGRGDDYYPIFKTHVSNVRLHEEVEQVSEETKSKAAFWIRSDDASGKREYIRRTADGRVFSHSENGRVLALSNHAFSHKGGKEDKENAIRKTLHKATDSAHAAQLMNASKLGHSNWKPEAHDKDPSSRKYTAEEVQQFEGFLSFLKKKEPVKKPKATGDEMRATFKKLERQTSIAKPQQRGSVYHVHNIATEALISLKRNYSPTGHYIPGLFLPKSKQKPGWLSRPIEVSGEKKKIKSSNVTAEETQLYERNKANAEAKKKVLRTAGVNAAISGKVRFGGSALQMGREAAKKLPSKGLAKAYRELPRVAEQMTDNVATTKKTERERRIRDTRVIHHQNRHIHQAAIGTMEESADKSLAAKAKKSGISLGTLRKVYNRGVAAWNSGHRPGTTPQQWGHARVNSYITKGKTYHTADKDLRRESVDVNEAFEREFGDK